MLSKIVPSTTKYEQATDKCNYVGCSCAGISVVGPNKFKQFVLGFFKEFGGRGGGVGAMRTKSE